MIDNFHQIETFIQNSLIKDFNVLRLNRFYGVFHLGTKSNIPNINSELLSFHIFNVDCPSIHLESEMREVDMIPRFYFKNYQYDDLSISFIESGTLFFRYFFFNWLNSILNADNYTRSYFDDHKADSFELYPIKFDGSTYRCDVFEDVIPFDINSINYNVQDDGSQTVLTTVKFKYIRHKVLTKK